MSFARPVIISIGTALPPYEITQEEADWVLTDLYKDELSARSMEVLHQVLRHPSVRTRRIAARSPEEALTIKNEDPDQRIARFTEWAVRLSGEALRKALAQAGLEAKDLSALIVNTCTGYLCPGISTYLIESMGLERSMPVYDLVGSGCGGAVPNLQLAEEMVRGRPGRHVACISVEISSAAFEMANDIGLIVSNAIFGDGAAAAIIGCRGHGIALVSTASAYFPESRDYVRFEYRHGRLHNRLDARLPRMIRKTVPPFLRDLLAVKELSTRDIKYWALHPGGDRILSAIQEELGLPDSALGPSRDVLSRCGNMSSPTVLFVLDRLIQEGMEKNAWCVMAAYGAGMSIHGYLLQTC